MGKILGYGINQDHQTDKSYGHIKGVIFKHLNVRLLAGSVKQGLARYDQCHDTRSEDEKIPKVKQLQTTGHQQVVASLGNQSPNGAKENDRSASEKPEGKAVLKDTHYSAKDKEQDRAGEAANPEWHAD